MKPWECAAELFIGMSAGGAASAGVFALITVIGILPRWAGRTRTASYVRWYEWAIILGGTIANICYFFEPELLFGKLFEGLMGIFIGIFVGGLIMSLAEVLDVFPIMLRRGRIKVGIPWMVLSMGLGKALGALFFFINL